MCCALVLVALVTGQRVSVEHKCVWFGMCFWHSYRPVCLLNVASNGGKCYRKYRIIIITIVIIIIIIIIIYRQKHA